MENTISMMVCSALVYATLQIKIMTVATDLPILMRHEVLSSARFLSQCEYFKNYFFRSWITLVDDEEFNIIVPKYGEPKVCARYLPNGKKNFIFMYTNSWDSDGCYGANPMLVLAHEMLHQVGLPPHYIPQVHWDEYITHDPIEVTIRECIIEAIIEGRPIQWQSDLHERDKVSLRKSLESIREEVSEAPPEVKSKAGLRHRLLPLQRLER